jgi:tetratricopeptide (TPR) repeat protein
VPERTLPLASQGTILHRLDRWPEAAEAFDRALNLAPDDEATLRARAAAREERGMRSGAADDFERLAFVLDVAGRAAEAAETAQRAAHLDPSSHRQTLARRLTAARTRPAERQVSGGSGGPAEAKSEFAAIESELAVESPGPAPVVAAEPPWPAPVVATGPPVVAREAALEAAAEGEPEGGSDGPRWPLIDLPSPAPTPIAGPPPDPELLMAVATARMEASDFAAARDLMLTAATVHRAAGRLDAALEMCLQLLTIAPGDPYVHLAIANLQLDRGWTTLATEKIDLLVRLTSLTGNTQAEADVHGLASERLRDAPVGSTATR